MLSFILFPSAASGTIVGLFAKNGVEDVEEEFLREFSAVRDGACDGDDTGRDNRSTRGGGHKGDSFDWEED